MGAGPDPAGLSAWVDGEGRIAADRAQALAEAGAVLIVDIRTPEEWARTGVPKGAALVPLTDGGQRLRASFVGEVRGLLDGALGRPVALICRSGARSAFARRLLLAEGVTAVLDVAEGMVGSGFGPGWLGRGLGIEVWSPPADGVDAVTKSSNPSR